MMTYARFSRINVLYERTQQRVALNFVDVVCLLYRSTEWSANGAVSGPGNRAVAATFMTPGAGAAAAAL